MAKHYEKDVANAADSLAFEEREGTGADNKPAVFSGELPEDEMLCRYISLWRAVITQALMDAGSRSSKPHMRVARAHAISWLSGVSPEFYTVCSLAYMDPYYVKTKAKEAMARGCSWRKEENKIGNIITEEVLHANEKTPRAAEE